MHRWVGRLVVAAGMTWAAAGCSPSGVGDPCTPEEIPPGGFEGTEAYLETSSVQCRTRVCLVYKLDGDPTKLIGDGCPGNDPTCVPPEEVDKRVYCSCRCDAPAEANSPTCSCPSGFECEPIIDLGGDGIRGSYCVSRDALCDEDGSREFCG